MQKNIFKLILLISFSCFVASCSRDGIINPVTPSSAGIHGAYIVSGGTFSTQAGLSFYDFRTGNYTINLFNPGNPNFLADGFLISNTSFFLTSQGELGLGTVYKLDSIGTVLTSNSVNSFPTGIANVFDKLYITTPYDSSVTILNSGSLAFIKKISIGSAPQEIISYSTKVFVCNSQFLSSSSENKLTVIDANSDSVIKKISLAGDPTSLALSNDNQILVGCRKAINAVLYKINPFSLTVSDSIIIPNGFVSDISVDRSTENIYFIQDAVHIASLDFISRNVINVMTVSDPGAVISSYAFDYEARKHCLGASYTIMEGGRFFVYSITGNLEKTFDTFANPGRIVIKNSF